MRIAFKGILLLAAAMTALAFSASAASAQEAEVEFVDEPTGSPCAPCTSVGSGESHIRAMPANIIVSRCDDTITTDTYHDGTGELEWSGVTDFSPGCATTNCTTGNPHWPAYNSGELGNGTGHMFVDICLRAGTTEINCTAEIRGTATGDHQGTYSLNASCLNGSRILEGSGSSSSSNIEAVHHSK